MTHCNSVFTNSCLRVPVDPISKMPKTAYERRHKRISEPLSIDSSSICSDIVVNVEADRIKEFYLSIPDYDDIDHLPENEFYSTLKSLRDKKKKMLGLAVEQVDHVNNLSYSKHDRFLKNNDESNYAVDPDKSTSYCTRRKNSKHEKDNSNTRMDSPKISYNLNLPANKTSCKYPLSKVSDEQIKNVNNLKISSMVNSAVSKKVERPKRNQSACSISWNDGKIDKGTELDENLYEADKYLNSFSKCDIDDALKSQSMPCSPLRLKKSFSPKRKNHITIPKPFKMTERDADERMLNELKCLRKSYSDDMLHQKCEKKMFKANPVPITSRIPLYDKILEDQAMRRAITKINSEAELRAKMKTFSFTKREEKGTLDGICERAVNALPKTKSKKKFKARPVPKYLFSNYFYDKVKEDEYFRSINKRVRAEEMLRNAISPVNMTVRDRSRISTPAAHSDLPVDASPIVPSTCSSNQQGLQSPKKEGRKRKEVLKDHFVTTSPQPFRFNTADRALKKMEKVAKTIYQESKRSEGIGVSGSIVESGARALSALELRQPAADRSNLAALLRAEAVRRKFEIDAARRNTEQRRIVEMKQRLRFLRSKPAWHLVKNNHEEDIAMRLQTRRDEERMRREEFLHQMELMYGRVQKQPMLFERYYAPRSFSVCLDSVTGSPRKTVKKRSKKKVYQFSSPNRSRKVSINYTPEAYGSDVADYLNRINIDDKYSDSEANDS